MSESHKIRQKDKLFINQLCEGTKRNPQIIINQLNKLSVKEINLFILELRNAHRNHNSTTISEILHRIHQSSIHYRNGHHHRRKDVSVVPNAASAGAGGTDVGNAVTGPFEKHLFIMGHGGIINEEYTIIPDKLNMVFYSNRSEPLYISKINDMLKSGKIDSSDHTLMEKSAMKNMIVELKGFYVLTDYPNIITSLGYSGIITDLPYGRVPPLFYNLEDTYFTDNEIEIINSTPIKIIKNGTSNRSKFVSPYLFSLGIKNIKIIHFGNKIYGIIYDNHYYINIINNMGLTTIDTRNSLIKYLKSFYAIKRVPFNINIQDYPLSEYKMHKLSLIFNNNSIIDTLDLIYRKYEYKLSEIFHKITESEFYLSGIQSNSTIYGHNFICRSDYTPIVNNVNNRNEASLMSGTQLGALERTESASNRYLTTFADIFERFQDAIKTINTVPTIATNEEIQVKIINICQQIRDYYNEHKYIKKKDMEFILELISMVSTHNNHKLRTYVNERNRANA